MTDDWIEYAIGDTTFAITQADADHPVPISGALVAFEVGDLAAEVARLRGHSVAFRGDIVETAVCRFIIALDPDGTSFLSTSGSQFPMRRKPSNPSLQLTAGRRDDQIEFMKHIVDVATARFPQR